MLRHSTQGAAEHFDAVLGRAAFDVMIETNVGAERAWQVQTPAEAKATHAALGGQHVCSRLFRCFHDGTLSIDARWAKRRIQTHFRPQEALEKSPSPGFRHEAAREWRGLERGQGEGGGTFTRAQVGKSSVK